MQSFAPLIGFVLIKILQPELEFILEDVGIGLFEFFLIEVPEHLKLLFVIFSITFCLDFALLNLIAVVGYKCSIF